jgi:hypothetical protein
VGQHRWNRQAERKDRIYKYNSSLRIYSREKEKWEEKEKKADKKEAAGLVRMFDPVFFRGGEG